MGLVDDFLNSGHAQVDSQFGQSTMVCNGQTFLVVEDSTRKSYEGALGGLESDIQATVIAQPSAVTNPRTMLQSRCTVGGVAYRVAEVSVGTVAIHFTLADPNESK